MEQSILQRTTIKQYSDLLKANDNPVLIKEIDEALSSQLSGVSNGIDLQLFQMQKDALLFHCKYLLALFDFDTAKMNLYAKRIDNLTDAIKKKTEKQSKSTPYESFLQWVLALKKYFNSDIDQSNDLTYLIVATRQMMNYNDAALNQLNETTKKK